ncbi:MAG: XRE family transcriptional regulator [Desulfobacteraceae bacterium]|nr:MAG: XRE family transcriptional regulator [Desulfobacteraceae bacterium]
MKNTIGETIRKLREEMGMTQQQLAHKSGVSIPTLSRAENGEYIPRHNNLAKIADALGCDISDIASPSHSVKNVLNLAYFLEDKENMIEYLRKLLVMSDDELLREVSIRADETWDAMSANEKSKFLRSRIRDDLEYYSEKHIGNRKGGMDVRKRITHDKKSKGDGGI